MPRTAGAQDTASCILANPHLLIILVGENVTSWGKTSGNRRDRLLTGGGALGVGAGGEDVEIDAQVVKFGKRVATVKVDFRRVRTADVVASGKLIAVSAAL